MSGSTTLLKYIKPTVSGDADVWGGYLNTNFDSIDKLQNVVTTTGSANAYLLTSGQSSLAYATGQRFRCKLNFTCSGSSTLNVDSIGAKTIKKRDAATNVSSSDLVSGTVYTFTYDGTNMVLETYVASDVQPLDATLTALAALSWASGNALLQFTAADTVSLTLTPSVSSVTASQAAAATTPSGTFTNTTDNASVRALRVGGARATPTGGDAAYMSYYLNNASSAATEMARAEVSGQTLTAGAETARYTWSAMLGGAMTSLLNLQAGVALFPSTNDLIALGTAALSFSDLYLASGGFINWNNGAAVLTQTGALLDVTTGALRTRIPVSSETSGTLTAASANKKVKMSGNCTIDASVFAADDFILFENNSASTRTVIQGTCTLRLSGSATTGTRTMAIRSAALLIFDTASDVTLHGGNVT